MSFAGPLFIVGFPRSGTQLLRALLNRHRKVAVATNESRFIPTIVKRFGTPSRLEDPQALHDFHRYLSRTTYFQRMQEKGFTLSEEELARSCDTSSWECFFEVIFRFYAPSAGEKDEDCIWGDKTPGYLNELAAFATYFPSGRFIHIVRDPRDVCLSWRRRWYAPYELTAENWRARLDLSRYVGRCMGPARYHELRYEDLLQDTENVMKGLCDFLGVAFSLKMTQLDKPASRSGDAGRVGEVVTTNREKWRSEMNETDIERVETIAYPQLVDLRYPITLSRESRPLGAKRKKQLKRRAHLLRLLPERIEPRRG